jgi:hypothetical protein
MVPWLGPIVASWPFWARTLAYTTFWATWAVFLQELVPRYQELLRRGGLISKKKDAPPTMNPWKLWGVSTANWFFSLTPTGMVLAAYNPKGSDSWTYASSWGDLWSNLIPLVLFNAVFVGLWDTQFYFWHTFCHQHKGVYR